MEVKATPLGCCRAHVCARSTGGSNGTQASWSALSGSFGAAWRYTILKKERPPRAAQSHGRSENDRERSVVSTHPAKPLGAPTPPQLAATYQHACDSHSCSHGLVSQRLCGGLAKSWCLCTHHCVMCGRAAAPVAPARRCKRDNCSVSQCTLQALAWRSTASAGRSFRNGCFSQMSRPEGFDSSSTPACPSSG